MTEDATPATQQTQRRTAATTREDRLKDTDVGRTNLNGKRNSGAQQSSACGFGAFEGDFREHHQTNAAQRRGPYECYRVVYCYGYALGIDPRYRTEVVSSSYGGGRHPLRSAARTIKSMTTCDPRCWRLPSRKVSAASTSATRLAGTEISRCPLLPFSDRRVTLMYIPLISVYTLEYTISYKKGK